MNTAVEHFVVGLDFGSDSVRAVLVSVETGQELGCGVADYPRWRAGKYCEAQISQYRHHPQDYIDAMVLSVKGAFHEAGESCAERVVGIGVDTTGSTPAPVDETGTVLALLPEFADNPNAMFVLWKDHTSVSMAERINTLAQSGNFPDYTQFIGGVYSSEWYWAKAAWIGEQDKAVNAAVHTWVELCDWIPALLTNTLSPRDIKRGVCAAGHKALWHESWGGLPSQAFLNAISPVLDGMRTNYSDCVYTSEETAGFLSKDWAEKLGLPEGIAIAVGGFDCHMGAVGAGAGANDLVKVIGTSTCDILMVQPEDLGDRCIKGICGQVMGSSLPELITLEAGQSAFGDIYAWYERILAWPLQQWALQHPEDKLTVRKIEQSLLPMLTCAVSQRQELNGTLVLDWLNGRRTPFANQRLTGTISNLNLGTDTPEIFHGLIESTAFGAKSIADSIKEQEVEINRVIAIGGIPKKSSLVMQMCSDIMGYEIAVVKSDQCCALGAAIFAAVAAGFYGSAKEAQQTMASPISQIYHSRLTRKEHYETRYQAYRQLGAAMETLIMSQHELVARTEDLEEASAC